MGAGLRYQVIMVLREVDISATGPTAVQIAKRLRAMPSQVLAVLERLEADLVVTGKEGRRSARHWTLRSW